MTEEIVLDGRLDLSASEALAARFLELRGQDIVLDGSGVTQLGAHAAQTLLVARRSWHADGKSFTILSPSADLLADWADLGLNADHLTGEGGGAWA